MLETKREKFVKNHALELPRICWIQEVVPVVHSLCICKYVESS